MSRSVAGAAAATARSSGRRSPTSTAGSRAYLDRWWDDFGVAAEIHGIPHLRVRRWDADCIRQNEVVIEGPRLLIFTSYAVRHEDRVVADQTRRLLRRGGWTG